MDKQAGKRVTNLTISRQEYDAFRALLEEACGIVLGDNKHYLVASRLGRLMSEFESTTIGELITKIKREPHSGLRQRVIDAMTTNETFWFRDNHPYMLLADLIFPEIAKKRPSQVKIWSAACSSGQEPYSISMIVQEYLQKRPGSLPDNVQIIGTDISPTMLKMSREALYDNLALSRGLSPERKQKFFTQEGEMWRVNDNIRRRVQFKELNLMNSYSALGKFDIIFCRNVLIYFSTELKRDILSRLARALVPGGYLFLGSTETLASYSDEFETVRHQGGVVYRLKEKS